MTEVPHQMNKWINQLKLRKDFVTIWIKTFVFDLSLSEKKLFNVISPK